jgi:alkylated DNA repair protein (DNA oxidative demethylase)
MCLGLYWNPKDYTYTEMIPGSMVTPHSIPERIMILSAKITKDIFSYDHYKPQSVMVNYYTSNSSMGLHVDKDEANKTAPIIGLNFGSACRFIFESEEGELKDLIIPGNSLYVFGNSARLMRHGLKRIYSKTLSPGTQLLLKNRERLNLTIRQVW